jgi:hypothetical protein
MNATWSRLQRFDVDTLPLDTPLHAGALSFVARLARENAWSMAYAQRVFDEYKRFVFLAAEAAHAVTPSEDIDQAWHLHLVYTRSYWDDMCGGILGRPLHHGPTKGGVDEGARFDAQYRATLESYALAFGEPAPADLWPAAERRFGSDLRWRRVWTDRAWVIPKRAALATVAFASFFVGAIAIAVAS